LAGGQAATVAQRAFLDELTARELLIPSGVPGVYGRGEAFEAIRRALDALVDERYLDDVVPVERPAFPPLLPRKSLERIGYLANFPHLAGSVFSFSGDEEEAVELAERAERHEDWSAYQSQTDLVLVPAACYPAYPAVARRGPLGSAGVALDLGGSYVFRHEPSPDPARLQMFHQRELVRFGDPDLVQSWRDRWSEHAVGLLQGLGLDASLDVASDPFFGRGGRMLARSQRAQALKLEVAVPIGGDEPTAVASFNCHRDHFSALYELSAETGGPVHTACVGFGLERITLALLHHHGCDVRTWPAGVRSQLHLAA
jgi:seryl-tRNA synthetase